MLVQSMAAPAITISFEVLEESVGSIVSRVIPFSTIPIGIPIAPDMPTDLTTAPELPMVSPFFLDDTEFEPADELPERHVSLRPYDDTVSRWRDKVRFRPSSPSGSSSPDTTIPYAEILVAPTPPAPSTKITTTSPACISTPGIIASSAVRSRQHFHLRHQHPISFESSSDSASHTSESFLTASLQGTQISLEDHSHHSSERSRSSATSIPSTVHTVGALSSTRANLLPPHKRYKDVRAYIETETTAVAAIVDGLDIDPVMAGVETSFEPGLAVVESESKLEEAEADEEAGAKIQPEGTIEIRVYVATRIDIPDGLLMPDAIEQLRQLEEGTQEQEGRNLIAEGERSGLLERVVALEGSNTSLRDALGIERVRADSLQRRLGCRG
ncbi:hypothetical protein Tco_1357452 [Tanacetum coccineum]